MKRRHLLAIVVALALFGATNAQAEPILVTITGQYPASIIGTAPPYVSQDFRFEFLTDSNPVPTRVNEPTSFSITPAVDYYVGGAF